jgi:hypothetical protein
VFYLKLKALLNVIVDKKLFGEVLAYVYRIEWQARGMPHAHMLFILKTKMTTARHIDEVVWAEVPCPVQFPKLYEIVSRCHIHDPCEDRPEAACRVKSGNGTCFRRFPKALNSVTTIIGDGYPQYRRRGRFSINRNGEAISDQWVVPYNPMLLEMFNCHVNCEIAANKRCFKYVYKYCFKSPDHATVSIDEIDAYLSGRLLTASEAVWRLLGLKLHKEYPAVMRLDVHLPECQQVLFDPTSDVRDIFDAAENSTSTLLEWFELNKRDATARQYLYKDIPEYYVWKNGAWVRRSRAANLAVGRVFGVSIHNFELFALRTLLHCVRGCTSFTDLLTVDGFIYPTFRAACAAFGHVNDDSEFIASFQEFVDTVVVNSHGLRFQFAFMLLNIKTINANLLFEHFAVDLCDGEVTDRSRAEALFDIENVMHNNGRSLADNDYGIDLSDVPRGDVQLPHHVFNNDYPMLSDEQQSGLDMLLQMLNSDASTSQNVLAIIAPAGTGKTLFINVACQNLHRANITVMCVAASALAATLLPNGKTAHAALHIPIEIHHQSYCNWDLPTSELLRRTAVIFWDEVSMVSDDVVECVSRSFCRLMNDDRMFGGKVVVFLGDFRQLAPVKERGNGELHSMLHLRWFQRVQQTEFTRNFRAIDDADYAKLLADIGDGEIDQIDVPTTSIVADVDSVIHRVYGDAITDRCNDRNMILAFTLEQCATVNDAVLAKIPGESRFSAAIDDLSACRQPDEYPSEYVQSLHIPRVPPAFLTLKIHARYMIIRNCNPPAICNGVLAELLSHTRYLCKMRLLTGPGHGKIVYLPRCTFRVTTEQSGLPFSFCRRQFPIMPAYCVTVHKSQGQSLQKIGIIAETDPFGHGQMYVALSRVGCWANVVFYSPKEEPFIMNKVSKQLSALMRAMRNVA